MLFIRKNVLEVWPQIDVIDRIESRCPPNTWASDSSINNGLGQTPKDVDEEDCPRSLCLMATRVIGLTARFFLMFPHQSVNQRNVLLMVKRTERLQGSKERRDDEYYTLFQDIADEVSLYLPQLRGKRILCPCDWNESYNEEIIYKEEGHVLNRDLFIQGGTVKKDEITTTTAKIEKQMDLVKNQFVYYLLGKAEEWGIKSISVCGYNPKNGKGIRDDAIHEIHHGLGGLEDYLHLFQPGIAFKEIVGHTMPAAIVLQAQILHLSIVTRKASWTGLQFL